MTTLAPTPRDVLPPPTVRAALIAARVTEVAGDVGQHLAIASEQAMPKPTFRARMAARLRAMTSPPPAPAAYDASGYYPVRRV